MATYFWHELKLKDKTVFQKENLSSESVRGNIQDSCRSVTLLQFAIKVMTLRPKPMSPTYHKWRDAASFACSALYFIFGTTSFPGSSQHQNT